MTGNYYGRCSQLIEVVEILSTECRGFVATTTNWGRPDRSPTLILPRKRSGWLGGAPQLHPGYPPAMLSHGANFFPHLNPPAQHGSGEAIHGCRKAKRKRGGGEGRGGVTIRPIWAQGRARGWATKLWSSGAPAAIVGEVVKGAADGLGPHSSETRACLIRAVKQARKPVRARDGG
jgi:hypothetical protein